MDADAKKVEVAAKAKKDMESKLLVLVKKLDYLERARREEERPLLEAADQKQQEEGKKYFEEQQATLFEADKKNHAKRLEEKKRLVRMDAYRVRIISLSSLPLPVLAETTRKLKVDMGCFISLVSLDVFPKTT